MLTQKIQKPLRAAIYVLSIIMCIFQIYTSYYRVLSPFYLKNVHLIFAFTIVFLTSIEKELRGQGKKLMIALYLLGMCAALCGMLYMQFNYEEIIRNIGIATPLLLFVGTVLIVTSLFAAACGFGLTVPVLTIICIAYLFVGKYLPGLLYHPGLSFRRVIMSMCTNFGGMYSMVHISATFVALFMIFGGILGVTGGSQFFVNLALALAGKTSAGPALAAVMGSAMMGTVNGSAVANVATTGVFTIPLMKKRGYSADFAAAVEAVASTGGMFAPPIMGVGAFVMAELTGIPYPHIAFSAIIPAVLYFLMTTMIVIQRSRKLGLKPVASEEIPTLKATLQWDVFFLLPIIGIVVCMVYNYTISRAALVGIGLCVLVFIGKMLIQRPREALTIAGWRPLADGMVEGIAATVGLAASLTCLGMMVDSIVISGLANRLIGMMLRLGGENQLACVLIAGLVAFAFGLGVPTTGCYIILAFIVAPVLVRLELPLLAVHLFLYYYAIVGNITPPVGGAALVASRIAGADFYLVCWHSCKMALTAFVLPVIFVFRVELLADGSFGAVMLATLTTALGFISLALVFERLVLVRNAIWEQFALLAVAAVLLSNFSNLFSAIAALAFCAIIWRQKSAAGRSRQTAGG